MKNIIAFVTLICAGSASAQWRQDFQNYWPKVVPVYIENTSHHTWTESEKKIAFHAMARKLWAQERSYSVQAVPGRESIGDRFKVRETKCTIVPATSRKGALIIVRVVPGQSNTTVPSAGLPVTISIEPNKMTGFPAYDFGLVIDHEFDHLNGGQH